MATRAAKIIPNELILSSGGIITRALRFISDNFIRITGELGEVWSGRFATGHIRLTAAGTDTHTVTVTIGGVTKVYELDSGGGVSGSNKAVTIGANATATAVNLASVITTNQGTLLIATADSGTVDLIAKQRNSGLTLSKSGASFEIQDNGDERDDERPSRVYSIRRIVSSEDVSRTKVVFNTGLSSIVDYNWKITDTNNVIIAWNGAITVSSGTISFDNAGATDWAATNIFYLWVIGYD